MNSFERMHALVEKRPVDRPALAGWMHMPLVDGNIRDFVKASIDWTEQNSFDFVKVMFNGLFSTQDFGNIVEYSRDPGVWAGKIVKHAIEHPMEYAKLKVPDVKKGILGREIESTKRIVDHFKGKVPVLATVFQPIATAQEMYCSHTRQEMMIAALEYNPNEVHKGLEIITETTLRFTDELMKAGIDGVFFASHYCSSQVISEDMHKEFVRKYDLPVLNNVRKGTWFNMLHLHGCKSLRPDWHYDYPVQALNWEDSQGPVETRLSIRDGMRGHEDKFFIGGLNQYTDFCQPDNDREKTKANIRARLANVLEQIGSDNFVFAPGCAFTNDYPVYRYTLIKEVIDDYVAAGNKL